MAINVDCNENVKMFDKPSYCFGCGNILKKYSVLICVDCLDDECEDFFKLASQLQEEEI